MQLNRNALKAVVDILDQDKRNNSRSSSAPNWPSSAPSLPIANRRSELFAIVAANAVYRHTSGNQTADSVTTSGANDRSSLPSVTLPADGEERDSSWHVVVLRPNRLNYKSSKSKQLIRRLDDFWLSSPTVRQEVEMDRGSWPVRQTSLNFSASKDAPPFSTRLRTVGITEK